ncbi:MAG: alpha/beta fold hydrolase [Candidatus Eiseniibacteriota bacterium]
MQVQTTPVRFGTGLVGGSGSAGHPAVYHDVVAPLEASAKPPIVLLHGGTQTGNCFLRTADGRPGWAFAFVRAGYRAILPDWPGSGRSGAVPYDALDGAAVCRGIGAVLESLGEPAILLTHSMSGAYGWRLLESHGPAIKAVVGVAPAQPGNIQAEPAVARETEDFVEPGGQAIFPRLDKRAPTAPSQVFVEKKLVGDSRRFPRAFIADYAASLHAIAPRLVYERINIGGSQLKVERPEQLKDKRVLVLTGTDDFDHPRALDEAIVTWLNGLGAKADYLWLADRGVAGNGHMLMLEDNSDDIARVILDWLDRL